METKKISKWDAAPESIKEMHDIITGVCDVLIDYDDDNKCEKMMVDALSKVLDDYNELEAKYNTDCGMISEYEEERQKDGEFAKCVGNHIVECIKYGAEHGYYELHPLNRFDIHIEETRVIPMEGRHAIPKIIVQCNNAQTEMERDTAQHELEELHEKYDELEAKYNTDCGMISDYAEENAQLKQKNEKASNNIRDLRQVLEENDIATYLNPVTVSWGVANVALQKKTEHFNTQLDNLREKLREAEKSKEKWIARYHDMSDICSRDEDDSEMLQAILRKDGYTIEYDGDIDDETIRCQDSFDLCKETTQDEVLYQYGRWTLIRPLNFSEAKANADAAILRNQCDRHIDLLDKLRWALEDKGIRVEWNEAALKWNLYDKTNTTCESCKQHYENELRIRCKEIDDKNKLIEELTRENHVFRLKNIMNKRYGIMGHVSSLRQAEETLGPIQTAIMKSRGPWRVIEDLNRKIKELEKENKSLRRTVRVLDGEDDV